VRGRVREGETDAESDRRNFATFFVIRLGVVCDGQGSCLLLRERGFEEGVSF
jgi:hypothetical protein